MTLAERIDADLATQPGKTAADARALLAEIVAEIKREP